MGVVPWWPRAGGVGAFLNACRATQTGIYITTHDRLYDMANGRDCEASRRTALIPAMSRRKPQCGFGGTLPLRC